METPLTTNPEKRPKHWFWQHEWELFAISNHRIYFESYWTYKCACGKHKQITRKGHWNFPPEDE